MNLHTLILASSLVASGAYASCSPDLDEASVYCKSCGNLEQNTARGFDLAHNALLDNADMQRELALNGSTEVNLVNPPHSSPGVLFYRVNLSDRSWQIANTGSWSEARAFHRELAAGFQASLEGGLASIGGFRSEVSWRQSMTHQFETAISQAITFGATPYTYVLEDQNGREIARRRMERNAGKKTSRVVGPSDLNADSRYREAGCIGRDPRHDSGSGDGGGGGSVPPGTGGGGGGGGGWGWPPPPRPCRLEADGFNTTLICP